jgi:hypothetical protein
MSALLLVCNNTPTEFLNSSLYILIKLYCILNCIKFCGSTFWGLIRRSMRSSLSTGCGKFTTAPWYYIQAYAFLRVPHTNCVKLNHDGENMYACLSNWMFNTRNYWTILEKFRCLWYNEVFSEWPAVWEWRCNSTMMTSILMMEAQTVSETLNNNAISTDCSLEKTSIHLVSVKTSNLT